MQFVQFIMLASLVMFASAQCNGTWSPSPGSSFVLSWEVSDDGLSVDFNVSVTTAANTWVAVGFSATRSMPNSDIAIAADDGTNSFVEDRYAATRTRPTYDTIQSFTNTMTERISGDLFFSFTRLINSADTNGQDVDLNVCQYVLYAWGGSVSSFTSPATIGRHTSRGAFVDQICLQQCDYASPTPSPSPLSSLSPLPSLSPSPSPLPSLSLSPSPSPDSSCSGSWSPSPTSSYILTWVVSSDGLNVDFNVSVTTPVNTWVSVGFSATRSMPNSDIAIAADDGTNSFVEDRYAATRTIPTFDTTQSFTNTMTERIGSKLSFSFTRLIDSADTNGQDVDLNVCQYVLYAWGGSVSSFTSPATIGRHTSPGAFVDQICLQQCSRIPVVSVTPSPSPSSSPIVIAVSMTLVSVSIFIAMFFSF